MAKSWKQQQAIVMAQTRYINDKIIALRVKLGRDLTPKEYKKYKRIFHKESYKLYH